MADFSSLSNTNKSPVEQILAEAMDHCVLEQVAAINCSSFSNSLLPSHFESRFQRLKTFPSKPFPKTQLTQFNNPSQPISEKPRKNPEKKMNSSSGFLESPSGSSNHSYSPNFNPKKSENKCKGENFPSKKCKGGKFLSRSLSFRSNSSDCSTKTLKTGCFWCFPKKIKKSENGRVRTRLFELSGGDDDWGKHDEVLRDLKSFSEQKQKKLMKLAKKDKGKINKEAEKIVKWAKQASARMEFSGIMDDDDDDDDLSDE